MTTIEFTAWPKTPRLFRDCVITEKIDGTNAAVGVKYLGDPALAGVDFPASDASFTGVILRDEDGHEGAFAVYAQSRNRLIAPGTDNAGFAAWVWNNAQALAESLGAGLHFGEWWGSGIQRGYGLTGDDKRFSLFNVKRHLDSDFSALPGVGTVPVLRRGTFDTDFVHDALCELDHLGSKAAPGFMRPEGVCVFHTTSGQVYKALLENDDVPKGAVQ